MSFAITLPDQIVAKVVNMGNIAPDAELTNLVKDKINDYAKEVALVAIILSDNYMKELYEKENIGYIACLDILHQWAVEYVDMFAYVEDWAEWVDSENNPYKGTCCWDDVVIAYGADKMKNYA